MSTKSGPFRFHEAVHGVYFDDLDAMQILHNARYLLLVERTIGSFWQRIGLGGTLEMQHNPDRYHLVRSNSIDYHKAFEGTGEVRVRVWIEKIGTTSLTFGFSVMPMDADLDHATGKRVIVRVDPQVHRPTPWTEAFREHVRPYVKPDPKP